MAIITRGFDGKIKSVILQPGERAPEEWLALKTAKRRGPASRIKFAAANEDFADFIATGIRTEEGLRVRAGALYAAYLRWSAAKADEERRPVMSLRAFGQRMKKRFMRRVGQGGTVTYEGIAPLF